MPRTRSDRVSVWPAFTDTMLAFVLVLVLMLAYQVARSVPIDDPPEPEPVAEEPVVEEPVGPPPAEVIRKEDQQRIAERIEAFRREGYTDVQLSTDGTVQYLTLGSDATFQPADDVLSERGRQLVSALSRTIVGTPSAERIHSLVEIQVGGHTDDVPINTRRFPSNWELSTARATRVVKSFVEAGIDPLDISMSATGYAEFDPRSSNTSDSGKARNRRIEMRLIYTDDEARQR
jgi:chemotaxis protein MotB